MSINENRHSEEGFTTQEQEAYASREYFGPLGIFEDFEACDDEVLNIPEVDEENQWQYEEFHQEYEE